MTEHTETPSAEDLKNQRNTTLRFALITAGGLDVFMGLLALVFAGLFSTAFGVDQHTIKLIGAALLCLGLVLQCIAFTVFKPRVSR